jgi:hypothetical protein
MRLLMNWVIYIVGLIGIGVLTDTNNRTREKRMEKIRKSEDRTVKIAGMLSLDEAYDLKKARTPGAKDIRPRKKKGNVYWEVHGTDGKDFYKLGFTSDKDAFTRESVKGGWKKEQLRFTPKTSGEAQQTMKDIYKKHKRNWFVE